MYLERVWHEFMSKSKDDDIKIHVGIIDDSI